VRVLLWAGAPFRAFKPARADVRADARELAHGTGVRVALDDRERLMHCHHEKLVVVDDELAFVGGIDLTDLGGDRWDTPGHPARGRLGWHDAGSRLRGPIVADVAEHLDLRWTAVTGERLPAVPVPAAAGDLTLQLLRTVPEHVYDDMHDGAFGILEGYMRALRSARELVYLESQFFWLPELVELLADKLRDPPGERFRVVVLLPSKPNNGQEDTRGMLARVAEADGGRGRFLATTIDAMTGATVDALRAREDRHRRRPLADDRLGQPQRPLVLQRHRGQRPGPRRGARPRDAAAPVERAPRPPAGGDRGRPDGRGRSPLDPDRPSRGRAPAQRERRGHRLRELQPSSRKVERLLGPMDAIVVDA
jgi:hypothetical protein